MSRLKTSYGVVVIIGILLVSSSQFTYAESVTSSPSLWERIVSFFDFSSTPAATIASPVFQTTSTTQALPTVVKPPETETYTKTEVQTLVNQAISSALARFRQTLPIQESSIVSQNTPYQSITQPLDSPSYQSIAAVGQTMSTGSGLSELRSDITAGRIPISSGTLTDSSFSGAATITSGSAAVSTLSVSGTGTTTVSGSLTVGSSTPWGNPLFLVGTSSPNFFIDRNSGLVGIGTSNPNSGYALTVQNPSSTITGINLTDSAGIQYGNISGFNINVKGSYVFPSGLTGLEMAFVSGRYAYVSDADGGAFIIFDVTDPANPVLISRTTTSGFGGVHGVFVQGPYAYLARRNLPFVVADISNPTSPTVVGQVTLSVGGVNGTRGISVQGHYVYLSVNNNLIAIDVSNPAAPVQVGVLNDVTNLNGDPSVVVQGRYAYVIAAAGPILSVIDISNPTSMVLVGHVTLGALASVNSSIAVSGKYAYIAGKDTLFIADISNPASPVLVSTLTDTTNFAASSRYFISVSGHYAYTVGNNVTITDITNSASPVIVTSKNLYNTSLRGVTMSGRYLYVGVYGEGHFDIVDTAGLDVPNASIGNIQSSDMTIWNNMDIGNNLNVRGGLTIGNGGISSIGPLSVSVASTSQTSAISAYFQGRVGIGSTTPWGQLSVNPNALGSGVPEFVIGSSTATHFVVDGAGRIGIGTASPSSSSSVDIEGTPTNASWSPISIGLNSVNNSTTNGGYYNRGIDLILYNKIASGVTNSGNIMGIQNSVYRNHVYAGDTGTLDSMYGYYSEYGHISKDSSAPATTNMYGMYLYPNARSGLVTNMYDLYINSVNTIGRTDTLTNHWSIYQADTTSKNYLAGKTGVGSTTPWGLLSVNPTALGSGVPEFVVGSSTATHFVVNGAGNVGIGTSNPGARLDIQSLNGASGSLILSEAGRGAKLVGEGDGAGAGAFSIQTLIGSTYTEKFRILSTGNVGIGTAAPLSNLQVNGGSNLPGTLTISTASVQGAVVGNIDFYNSISPAATTTRISAITRSDDSRYSALTFNGKIYPSATMSELMRIDTTGNVGIGTTSPTATLAVEQTGTAIPFVVSDQGTSTPFLTVAGNGNVGIKTQSPTADLSGPSNFVINNTYSSGNGDVTLNAQGANANVYLKTNGSNAWTVYSNLFYGPSAATIGNFTNPLRGYYTDGTVYFMDAAGGNMDVGLARNSAGVLRVSNASTGMGTLIANSVGIGTTSPYAKLSVVGTVVATDYHATSSTLGYQADNLLGGLTTLSTDASGNIIRTPSDINLKENVVPLTNSLDKLLKLQGVSYDWKDKERFGNTKEIGFVAQQVESIVPEVVKGGSYKSLNYGNMVALVVEAVKELNQKVTDLQTQMKDFVFDKLTAKIAYVDEANINNLNVGKIRTKSGIEIGDSICVDNVCVSKDKFKEMLLNGGGVTYGSAADQMKGINPLLNTVTTTDTSAPATTTPTTIETETVASTTPVTSTTSTIETIEATTTPAVVPTPVPAPEPVVIPTSPSTTETASSTSE